MGVSQRTGEWTPRPGPRLSSRALVFQRTIVEQRTDFPVSGLQPRTVYCAAARALLEAGPWSQSSGPSNTACARTEAGAAPALLSGGLRLAAGSRRGFDSGFDSRRGQGPWLRAHPRPGPWSLSQVSLSDIAPSPTPSKTDGNLSLGEDLKKKKMPLPQNNSAPRSSAASAAEASAACGPRGPGLDPGQGHRPRLQAPPGKGETHH